MRKVILSIILVLILIIIDLLTIFDKTMTYENDHLRIMSYNLKYASSDLDNFQSRSQMIVDQILLYQPDSLGIQEGDYYWMFHSNGLSQLKEVYDFVGVGRDDGFTEGEYAAIFYNPETLELLDSGNFWLSKTPTQPSIGWDAAANRICTWAKFKRLDTNEIIYHMNTHLDHKGAIAREESVTLLLEKIKLLDAPVILTGDFNFFEKTKNYDLILKSNLKDAKYSADTTMKYGTVNWFLPFDFKWFPPIDFCFVSQQLNILRYQVDMNTRIDRVPVSDHFPIIVDIE